MCVYIYIHIHIHICRDVVDSCFVDMSVETFLNLCMSRFAFEILPRFCRDAPEHQDFISCSFQRNMRVEMLSISLMPHRIGEILGGRPADPDSSENLDNDPKRLLNA